MAEQPAYGHSAEPSSSPPGDIRPVVARATGSRSVWIFAAILLAAGGGLFYALQMRRLETVNPSLQAPTGQEAGVIASPPELVIPPAPQYAVPPAGGYAWGGVSPDGSTVPAAGQSIARQEAPRFTARENASSTSLFAGTGYQPAATAPTSPGGPAFAYQAPTQVGFPQQEKPASKGADGRVEARPFINPGTTVPQGSVIQAVMETALDSTRAGFARAIVSRDVQSFDGTRVLVPRGSRLFGSYQSDVSLGQKRALIQWQRLTRPDGSLIDLDSPSADPLGRAGVKGKVNTHFFQRYSAAILQSVLDIGVRAATRETTGDTFVVGLPNSSTQIGSSSTQSSSNIQPTLKIAQGTSVSVFVARDLDFTSVEH